jgi:predicted oxidoreductase
MNHASPCSDPDAMTDAFPPLSQQLLPAPTSVQLGVDGPSVAPFAWVMAHPSCAIPIIGSQHAARIREAATATAVRWTRAHWYDVLVAARGEPLP